MNEDIEDLRDALDHVMRVAKGSATQTRRLRWIAERARCALEGGEDWRDIDIPPNRAETMARQIQVLKARLMKEKEDGHP